MKNFLIIFLILYYFLFTSCSQSPCKKLEIDALNYLKTIYDPTTCLYKSHPKADNPDPLTTVHSWSLLNFLGRADLINSKFKLDKINYEEMLTKHNLNNLTPHEFLLVRTAIKYIFNQPEDLILPELEPFLNLEYLVRWMDEHYTDKSFGLDLQSLWFYIVKKFGDDEKIRIYTRIILNKCDLYQDPETGFWLFNGKEDISKTFHILTIYYLSSRPFNYEENLAKRIISFQNPGGDFFNGGCCEDMDSVVILVHILQLNPSKDLEKEIKEALSKSIPAMLNKQNKDGGFPETSVGMSTAKGTLFRLATIYLAAESLGDKSYSSCKWLVFPYWIGADRNIYYEIRSKFSKQIN